MTLRQAERLAYRLLDRWGLHGWDVEFMRFPVGVEGFLAECDHYDRIIRLNAQHVLRDSHAQVKDSILHEIAHALTPQHARAHGFEWRRAARTVGAWPSYMGLPGSKAYICRECNYED